MTTMKMMIMIVCWSKITLRRTGIGSGTAEHSVSARRPVWRICQTKITHLITNRIIIIWLALLISRLPIFLLFWRTKLANVLETSERLPFYFSAFLFCCSDSTAFCFTIHLFLRTVRSHGHSYYFLC